MGHVRTTVKRLRVHMVDADKGLLAVEGAVPGPNGGLLLVFRAGAAGPRPAQPEEDE